MDPRPYQRSYRGHLNARREHILYRSLSRFRIWPQNWPRRSHFRAPPQSFLRLYKSVKPWLQNKPFGFWGFLLQKCNGILTYLIVYYPLWLLYWLQGNFQAQWFPFRFHLELNIDKINGFLFFRENAVLPFRHVNKIGCVRNGNKFSEFER